MKILQFIKRKETIIAAISIVIGIVLGGLIFGKSGERHDSHNYEAQSHEGHDHETMVVEGETIYTCSMHPQIRQDGPGDCPICAMDLIPVETKIPEGENIDPNEIQMTESAMKLADIQTVDVKRGIPEKKLHLLGKVKADERNISKLTARYGGRLEKLYVNYTGQRVRKGEKLGLIYSPELITAQKELLEAVKFKESNPSFYSAARTRLKLWDLTEKQIKSIEENGEPTTYFEIFSPISGTVTKRNVSLGEYIKEGSALFEVTDLTQIWVMFEAYESDLPWISVGASVNFTLQAQPGLSYKGKISFIDPFIDPATRVAKIRVEMSNPDLKLKPEMFANGIIEAKAKAGSHELLIPRSAILWTGKNAVVYVKVEDREDPSFLYREIVLGPEADDYYVVAKGLKEGEEIVMNGVFKIDASAQLAGKSSMMNPEGGRVSTGHDHGNMAESSTDEHAGHQHETESNEMTTHSQHEMFYVGGACGMCKDRIETAAVSVEGVISAEWDEETSMIHLILSDIDIMEIHKAIAAVGHDTELIKADDAVYNDLPGCCLYREE